MQTVLALRSCIVSTTGPWYSSSLNWYFQVSYLPGSSAKVVDSVLALKAYHDWRLSGGSGLWKYGGSVKSPRLSSGRGFSGLSGNGVVKSPSLLSQTNMSRQSNQQRRRWDGPEDVDISSPDCVEGNGYKAGRVLAVTIPQANGTRPRSDLSLESEALMSPNNVSGMYVLFCDKFYPRPQILGWRHVPSFCGLT